MIEEKMIKEDIDVLIFRFVHIHSVFSVKRVFMDSKNKVARSRWNNCGFNSPEVAILRL